MKRYLVGIGRFLLVTVGIIILTSFTIDATDLLRGSQSALGIFAQKATEGSCPQGMVVFENAGSRVCIDRYEAVPSDDCTFRQPQNITETMSNSNDPDCVAESVPGVLPWTHVAKPVAEQLCARSGKRLPTAAEWYIAARGTPDNESVCNTAGTLRTTGSVSGCVSGVGGFDMVGNVWEWVSDEVIDGVVSGTVLPSEGYIARVNESGIPVASTSTGQVLFNGDYVWSVAVGSRAMMRGGFHGSRTDAGVYSTHANIDQSFENDAVGFRCVRTL